MDWQHLFNDVVSDVSDVSDRLAPYLAKLNQTDSRMEQLDAFKLAKTKPACPRAFVDQNVKRPGVGVQ